MNTESLRPYDSADVAILNAVPWNVKWTSLKCLTALEQKLGPHEFFWAIPRHPDTYMHTDRYT